MFLVLCFHSRDLRFLKMMVRIMVMISGFSAGGDGMDVTKKNKRDGSEVTERSKSVRYII